MSKDISSSRIERLFSIVEMFKQKSSVTREELLKFHQTKRTMERDLAYLRNQFGMQIVYNGGTRSYQLQNIGRFPF